MALGIFKYITETLHWLTSSLLFDSVLTVVFSVYEIQ